MKILFVTSNPKKTISPAGVLNQYGIEVGHVNPEPEIMEIQAESPGLVATAKVQEAFRRVKKPLFCMDAGFFIDALDGFPGVFVKQVSKQIGAHGYLKLLMKSGGGWYPRTCEFVDVLAYMDEELDTPELFVRRIPGVLIDHVDEPNPKRDKSALFRIFVPEGETRTLSSMSDDEYDRHRKSEVCEDFLHEFALYLRDR